MKFQNIAMTIGNTPIVKVNNLDLNCELYLKLEYFNPAGSLKDRIAFNMINDLLEKGILKEGYTIIEPTSGNTGIAIAMIAAAYKLKAILTMPSSMSIERQKLLKAYGATVVLTDSSLGMQGAIDKANELKSTILNSVILAQFDNPLNPSAHKKTAEEILSDLPDVDVLVTGIGTGGTITGLAKYLKEKKNLLIFGVEPEESPVITKGYKGKHKIQGIGAGFIPKILDLTNVDKVYTTSSEKAANTSRLIAKKEGILLGISSGASISVALQLATLEEFRNKKILVMCHDNGERYLSTDLYDC